MRTSRTEGLGINVTMNDVALALLRNELPVPGTAMTPAPEPNLGDHLRYIDYLMGKKVEDMGSAIARALMAPGNALRGEYDQVGLMGNGAVTMADPRMYDDAAELAGLIGLGVMPMPRPTNSLGMFGGMNAKTADLDALKRAQTLEATGAPRDAIWNDTGWFKGADGQWRFEIDDSASRLRNATNEVALKKRDGLAESFQHDELYQAYPELADLKYKVDYADGGRSQGYYLPGEIGVSPFTLRNRSDARSVTLHEAQHAIQQREGFAKGSSLEASEGQYNSYHRSGGEVEARNVQTRMNMTPEQRRAQAPWLTQDVPDNQQIIRRMLAGL